MRVELVRTNAVLASLVCVALASCGAAQPPSPAATAPAATAADSGGRCEDGDIECDERTYQLEETLAMYEAGITATLDPSAQECWRADVASARRSVEACYDIACRQTALLERIASLHDLQPLQGRAAIPLPPGPLLVAVIGAETIAAPGTPDTSTAIAFAASGHLVHALEDPLHRGIAVRTDSNQAHVFIPDAGGGRQPAHQKVQGLLTASPTARVLVRGSRKMEPDGVPNFDATRCRLVYQLR